MRRSTGKYPCSNLRHRRSRFGWRFNSNVLGDQYGNFIFFFFFFDEQLSSSQCVDAALVVLETARRVIRAGRCTLVRHFALLYGLFGRLLPGEFGHSGTPVESFSGRYH